MGNNATTFLRFFAFFNFSFVLVPIASLYWFTVPFEKELQLQELSKQHPSMILILIRENVVFLACVLLCATLISAEIAYCLKTNWSTFKVSSFGNRIRIITLGQFLTSFSDYPQDLRHRNSKNIPYANPHVSSVFAPALYDFYFLLFTDIGCMSSHVGNNWSEKLRYPQYYLYVMALPGSKRYRIIGLSGN